MTHSKALTEKQRSFVEAYLLDPTSKAACARKAGYSEKASSSAAKLLWKNPKVQAALQEAQEDRKARLGITEDRVLRELASIAYTNIQDLIKQDAEGNTYIDIMSLKREHAAAINEINVQHVDGPKGRIKNSKIKVADKLAALQVIGKHIGMFKEQVDVTGKLTLEQLVLGSMEKTKNE